LKQTGEKSSARKKSHILEELAKKIPEIFDFNGVIDGVVDFNSKALRGSLDCGVKFSTEF